jgi:hypothetical protein
MAESARPELTGHREKNGRRNKKGETALRAVSPTSIATKWKGICK